MHRVHINLQNSYDYGNYADPNQSPVCGACIIVTGPLGAAKATIQDMVRKDLYKAQS